MLVEIVKREPSELLVGPEEKDERNANIVATTPSELLFGRSEVTEEETAYSHSGAGEEMDKFRNHCCNGPSELLIRASAQSAMALYTHALALLE